ncbi:MAG: helix-turn-helix domain-containing protein [Bacteroidales bacterium]|jgi:transcriptional regulator with XRE-family HTH domain|nr:helix-turn-helix domain-containing protein [Bacteroidales bacterium]
MFFGQNIKLLRRRRKLSQADVASSIDIPRSSYSGYENQVVQPPFITLVKISEFFNLSIDKLIKYDLSTVSEFQLSELEKGFDVDVKGDKIRVLATTVDSDNRENVELIPHKAKAGYTAGYSDPEYINSLPVIKLPFLSDSKKYRAFPISGDSMLPLVDGTIIIAEYIKDWRDISDGDNCIVVTANDGLVLKKVFNRINDERSLLLISSNPVYKPYFVDINDVLEVWKQVAYIGTDDLFIGDEDSYNKSIITDMQKDIALIKKRIFD